MYEEKHSPVISTFMPSKLYAVHLQTEVLNIRQWAMPQKLLIHTLVKDDNMYYMPGIVSKEAVCNYTAVTRLGMLVP